MYHVDITNKGAYSFQVKSKDYEFAVAVKGKGVTPPDALLASLGTCLGVYIVKYAEGMKLNVPEFSISVDAEFSDEAPACFRKINVTVDLKGLAFDEHKLKGMERFIKNCPVHNTLKNNPEIEINFSGF